MNYNENTSWGRAFIDSIASVVPTFGKILVVMPITDSNFNRVADIVKTDPDGVVRLYATVAAAYTAATSNQNDVIVLSANAAHAITAMLDVSKNRVHFVGLGATGLIAGQRARITMGVTTAITDVYALKVTGTGCSFHNIKVSDANTLSQNVAAAYLGGEANVYNNFSVEHTAQADQAINDVVFASDTCTYNYCKFGTRTVLRSAVTSVAKLGVSATVLMKDNYFNFCEFCTSTTQATSTLMATMTGGSSVQYSNIFRNTVLSADVNSNSGAVALTVGIKTAAETEGYLLFDSNTLTGGIGKIATAAVGNTGVYCANGVATANAGMAIKQTN